MGDRGRAGDHLGVAEHAAVTLRIRTLGHDGQVHLLRIKAAEGAEQAVDISADASSVSGNAGGVDEHSRGATGGHEATPKEVVIQTTGKRTPGMHRACDRDTA
ncbi:hypothetical protein GCM10010172_12290 [Paractinoplanes ferrugineus]|uniref:Uncharacterized protein n=1 Tax=Paractinoplanes ferrugineus TaxID=113564 RepID=A0A919IX54_9ACTN|nr:hypothetical protein Afe05nite_16340 [Actinoplanes ferrugineus]